MPRSSWLTKAGGGLVRCLTFRASVSLFASFSKTRGAIESIFVAPCLLYLKAERKPSKSAFVSLRLMTSSESVSLMRNLNSSTEMFPLLSASTFSRKYFSNSAGVPNLSYKCLLTLCKWRSIASSLLAGTDWESRTT